MKKTGLLYLIAVMLAAPGVSAAGNGASDGNTTQNSNEPPVSQSAVAHRMPRDMSLGEMRRQAHARAENLDHMSVAQWEEVRQKAALHGGKAANMTLVQAQENMHTFAKKLDAMTPQQWEEFKNRMEARHGLAPQPTGSADAKLPANGN